MKKIIKKVLLIISAAILLIFIGMGIYMSNSRAITSDAIKTIDNPSEALRLKKMMICWFSDQLMAVRRLSYSILAPSSAAVPTAKSPIVWH